MARDGPGGSQPACQVGVPDQALSEGASDIHTRVPAYCRCQMMHVSIAAGLVATDLTVLHNNTGITNVVRAWVVCPRSTRTSNNRKAKDGLAVRSIFRVLSSSHFSPWMCNCTCGTFPRRSQEGAVTVEWPHSPHSGTVTLWVSGSLGRPHTARVPRPVYQCGGTDRDPSLSYLPLSPRPPACMVISHWPLAQAPSCNPQTARKAALMPLIAGLLEQGLGCLGIHRAQTRRHVDMQTRRRPDMPDMPDRPDMPDMPDMARQARHGQLRVARWGPSLCRLRGPSIQPNPTPMRQGGMDTPGRRACAISTCMDAGTLGSRHRTRRTRPRSTPVQRPVPVPSPSRPSAPRSPAHTITHAPVRPVRPVRPVPRPHRSLRHGGDRCMYLIPCEKDCDPPTATRPTTTAASGLVADCNGSEISCSPTEVLKKENACTDSATGRTSDDTNLER